MDRYILFIMAPVFLLSTYIFAFAYSQGIMQTQAVVNSNWFLGQGINPGEYFVYNVSEINTDGGKPFILSLQFWNHVGPTWITTISVVDQGSIVSRNVSFSETDMLPITLVYSDKTIKLRPYELAYAGSLALKDGFYQFARDPSSALTEKSNNNNNNNNIRIESEKIAIPGGTFDSRVFSSGKQPSETKTWIVENFPYPVKALSFANTSSIAFPKVQYAYELINYGNSTPPLEEYATLTDNPVIKSSNRNAVHTTFDIKYTDYEDPTHGFMIQHPSNWKVENQNNSVLFYHPSYESTTLTEPRLDFKVLIDPPVPPGTTLLSMKNDLEQKREQMVLHSSEVPGKKVYIANLVNLTKTSGGYNALKVSGNNLDSYGKLFNGTTLYIMSDPINFGLVYTGPSVPYKAYLPIAEKMMNSFKIIEKESSIVK